ncbi:hypothetical protein RPHASCH2410_CH12480 [Rhizobium phaseoli Ch24-10]|nr:hypothetical protein RPHASCH2410_CH12480 [Rhizobium phaseoli Ch24-10]
MQAGFPCLCPPPAQGCPSPSDGRRCYGKFRDFCAKIRPGRPFSVPESDRETRGCVISGQAREWTASGPCRINPTGLP